MAASLPSDRWFVDGARLAQLHRLGERYSEEVTIRLAQLFSFPREREVLPPIPELTRVLPDLQSSIAQQIYFALVDAEFHANGQIPPHRGSP
jgi:hypothetical protein